VLFLSTIVSECKTEYSSWLKRDELIQTLTKITADKINQIPPTIIATSKPVMIAPPEGDNLAAGRKITKHGIRI
jgi:hypothetical protein